MIVVGSGAGGLSAAVVAARLGLSVLVLEKEALVGGTTAWSGGWMWVPRNPLANAAGIEEPLEAPLSYLRHATHGTIDEERAQLYLRHAPAMVSYFMANTSLAFIDGNAIPDFDGTNPAASVGGRSVCAAPFNGLRLGKAIDLLKPPLQETTLWGMGIASGAEMRHYLMALRSPRSLVYVAKRVMAYAWDLLRYGRGMRLLNGNALVAGLLKSTLDAGGTIRVNATVLGLLEERPPESGATRVTGVVLRDEKGTETTLTARKAVVLACGGFPHDRQRKSQWLPHAPTGDEHVSAASWGNTGDGLRMGERVGAAVPTMPPVTGHAAALAPVSVVPRDDGSVAHFPHLVERGKPGLIAVTQAGRRFCNEANSYYDVMNQLLKVTAEDPSQQAQAGRSVSAWLVVDHTFIRRYGLGAVKPAPMPMGRFLRSGYLLRAPTLSALAKVCGIDEKALLDTVQTTNLEARQGVDTAFGKGQSPYNRMQGDASHPGENPCVAPLETAPFYAVKVQAGSLGTFAGLRTNGHGQVINRENRPIEGLYANGNDADSLMAGHYPSGGITLGPAMTFGYLLAHHAAGVTPLGSD
jgi:succinate dehydrogenase/fumarate reductase flavoprotein subunit